MFFCNSIYVLFYFLWIATISVSTGPVTSKLGPNPIWNMTHADNLRHDLLLNYDKFARPTQHYNTTVVKIGMSIKHIEVNEMRSTLTVHTWLQLSWQDEKLKWNPDDYGGLKILHLAEHEIWQPDISVYNSATTVAINAYANTYCLVYPNGEVLWVPPSQLTVFCNFNFKYWPFDTQKCYIKFGSWTSHGIQIDLEVSRNRSEIQEDVLIRNTEWDIVDVEMEKQTIFYNCCEEPYISVQSNISIARVSPSYKILVVTPALVIAIMILSSYWLPPNAGEKIILNVSTAVVICMFLLYFTQKLPAMGSHTPLLVLFYNSCLYIVAFSLIGSIIVISLSKTRHHKNLPWIIKRPLTGTFGKLLGLHDYIEQSSISTNRITAEEMRDHQVTDFDDNNPEDEHHIIRTDSRTKNTIQQDWILFAAAIDRISFCFYSFLFAILAIVYSV